MDHLEHQRRQLLEGQWYTAVILATYCQDQLQWTVRLVEVGVLDQLVKVSNVLMEMNWIRFKNIHNMQSSLVAPPFPLFPMGHLEHQQGQHLEGQWSTPVTMATHYQDQLQWPVRLVEVGVLDQLVKVSNEYKGDELNQVQISFTSLKSSLVAHPFHLFPMDHLEHQQGQLSEGQWHTAVTLATYCQDQLQWPVRLAEVGVLDQLVKVSNESKGGELNQVQISHSRLLWLPSIYFQWVTWNTNKDNIWRDSDIQL